MKQKLVRDGRDDRLGRRRLGLCRPWLAAMTAQFTVVAAAFRRTGYELGRAEGSEGTRASPRSGCNGWLVWRSHGGGWSHVQRIIMSMVAETTFPAIQRIFGEPVSQMRPRHQLRAITSRRSKKREEIGGFMAELRAAPMVASGDGDASCTLSGGRFPLRSHS